MPLTHPDADAPREGVRTWRVDWQPDLLRTLAPLRRGGGDPTWLVPAPGQVVLGVTTPAGPGTLHLAVAGQVLTVRAWGGPGVVEWLLDGAPELVGAGDRPQDLVPRHAVLRSLHAQWSSRLRVMRTRRVWDALLPAVIEQKVTGQEAFGGYRSLVRAVGTRAPGPAGARGLMVPPSAQVASGVPSWVWLQCGIDASRSDTVVRAARAASRLERLAQTTGGRDREGLDAAHRTLRTVPGIGVWTAAEVAQRALGDPDAVSWRDYHVAGHVTHALTGVEGDDVDMARVLAPYAGQRYRVQLLLAQAGAPRRERHGPRMAPRTHLPR